MDVHIMSTETCRLLAEIRGATSAASDAVIHIGVAVDPTAATRTLHAAITRGEAALRALRELHPIPDAPATEA